MEVSDFYKDLPQLETARLILRKITEQDAGDFFEYASDHQVALYTSWLPHQTIEETQNLIRNFIEGYQTGRVSPWGIQFKADGKFIGTIGFSNWQIAHDRAEIYYSIARAYWGQGLVTEAVRTVIDFGFTRMKLNRIEAYGAPENVATYKIMRKMGMQYEGLMREDIWKGDHFEDSQVWAVLRRDWSNPH